MATTSRENIAELHELLTVTLEPADYLPAFEKSLKENSKKATMPGFRKGMVPAGLIKKMYGPNLFAEQVLRTADKELFKFIDDEKIKILTQPIPVETEQITLDMQNPGSYTFQYEIGLKTDVQLPDLANAPLTKYAITVSDEMVNEEIKSAQNKFGKVEEKEEVTSEDDILNVLFTEVADKDKEADEAEGPQGKDLSLLVKYFAPAIRSQWMGKKIEESITLSLSEAFEEKEREWIISDLGLSKEDDNTAAKRFVITISTVGILVPKELGEELYAQVFPSQDVTSEDDFRAKMKTLIENEWRVQTNTYLQSKMFDYLDTQATLHTPEAFLKKWIFQKEQEEKKEGIPKTAEEVEKEMPTFLRQLKWSALNEKIVADNNIQVKREEIEQYARYQIMSYMGNNGLGLNEMPWLDSYAQNIMQDQKFVDDTYHRIRSNKVLAWAASQVQAVEVPVSPEEFNEISKAEKKQLEEA